MLDLAFRSGSEAETDSRRIGQAFGKRHADVIRAIESLDCPDDFAKRNFALCYEINELQNGKPNKYYRVTDKSAVCGFSSLRF